MYRIFLLIGLGSGIGGICRYLLQQYVQKQFPSSIPYGTLSVNVIGCFVIGIIYALGSRTNILSPEVRLLLATGLCGGFTTFSSFAYENVALLQEGDYFYTAVYIISSIIAGLIAVYLGILLIKLIH